MPPMTENASTSVARLIDQDTNKHFKLKRCLIFGPPGPLMICMLRILGFQVYDMFEASANYLRDYPLWLEAARLKAEGSPYSTEDLNKLTGHYNVIIGEPGNIFAADLVKSYPYAKIIFVTADAITSNGLVKHIRSIYLQTLALVDPKFFGVVLKFAKVTAKFEPSDIFNSGVSEKNILKTSADDMSWNELCGFLGTKIPDVPLPPIDRQDPFRKIMIARLQHTIRESTKALGLCIVCLLMCLGFSGATFIACSKLLHCGYTCSLAFAHLDFAMLGTLFVLKFYFNLTLDPTSLLPKTWPHVVWSSDSSASSLGPQRSDHPSSKTYHKRGNWQTKQNWKQRKRQDRSTRPAYSTSAMNEQLSSGNWQGFQSQIREDDVLSFMKREAEAADFKHEDVKLNTIYEDRKLKKNVM